MENCTLRDRAEARASKRTAPVDYRLEWCEIWPVNIEFARRLRVGVNEASGRSMGRRQRRTCTHPASRRRHHGAKEAVVGDFRGATGSRDTETSQDSAGHSRLRLLDEIDANGGRARTERWRNSVLGSTVMITIHTLVDSKTSLVDAGYRDGQEEWVSKMSDIQVALRSDEEINIGETETWLHGLPGFIAIGLREGRCGMIPRSCDNVELLWRRVGWAIQPEPLRHIDWESSSETDYGFVAPACTPQLSEIVGAGHRQAGWRRKELVDRRVLVGQTERWDKGPRQVPKSGEPGRGGVSRDLGGNTKAMRQQQNGSRVFTEVMSCSRNPLGQSMGVGRGRGSPRIRLINAKGRRKLDEEQREVDDECCQQFRRVARCSGVAIVRRVKEIVR
ncbi:hypothetical protein C8R43DRAFT_956490 [Mycena crocata]|nr:hypothetical protein C8R43DRAFT_956490 [Mycena crocata]